MRYFAIILASLSFACSGDPTTVSLRVYTAADQVTEPGQAVNSNILQAGVIDTLEVVAFEEGASDALYSQRFSVADGQGNLDGIPIADNYRFEVRGYTVDMQGVPTVYAYGAATGIEVSEGAGVSVQIGRAGCVGLNEPSPIRTRDGEADMAEARYGASVTTLSDGRIMIAGGAANLGPNGEIVGLSRTVEFYEPTDSVFSRAAFELPQGLAFHTANLLPDGKILFVGGLTDQGAGAAPSEVIFTLDLLTGIPEPVTPGAGATFQARFNHQALSVPGGDVLIVGGESSGGAVLGSTFRYFAQTRNLTEQGSMQVPRTGHSLTPIARGETELGVVIGGKGTEGNPVKAIETFSVNAGGAQCPDGTSPSLERGCWIQVANLTTPRWGQSAVAINGGAEILIAGGFETADQSQPIASMELLRSDFKGDNGQVGLTFAAGQLSLPRGHMGAALTTDGVNDLVVFSGGVQNGTASATIDRVERRVVAGQATGTAPPMFVVSALPMACQQVGLPEFRWGAQSVRLANDVILTVGGALQNNLTTTRRAELYFPQLQLRTF